ncbi:MAG: hypothetical protein PGN25_05855 [Methylorubrum populi]
MLHERDELWRAKTQVDQLSQNSRIPRGSEIVVRAQKLVEATREHITTLNDRVARASSRAGTLVALVKRIDDWRTDHAGDMIEPFAGPAPKLARNEKPVDAITRLRTRLAELSREATKIHNAPVPAAEAKAAAKAFIEHMAFSGRPDVSGLLAGQSRPDFPNLTSMYQQPVMTDGNRHTVIAAGTNFDALGLTAWLHGPAMLKALEAQIDAEAKDDRAIPTEGRAERLEALRADMLAIEREEEAIIRAITEDGIPVERRPDASPEAVLQVRVAA